MNYKEWKKACKEGLAPRRYDNASREIQKSLKYNSDPNATVRHHLRDTEEQRKYNDDHYELWGFEIDENGNEHFEYGKYIIFVTEEWHSNYHKDSEETKQRKSDASKKRWEDPDYRESQTAAIIKVWSDDDRRRKRSAAYTGKGNPFYGKHHSKETLEKLSGENNGMYGKHHTEDSRKKMSDSRMGHIVTEETRAKISASNTGHEVSVETREKISIANTGKTWSEDKKKEWSIRLTGEGNPFYGKHHTQETKDAHFIGENNPMYGRHHTEEAKRTISEANKGKIVSQETRDRLSKAVSGEKNGMYGKKHTEEALEKLRHSRGVELQKQCSLAYKEYKSSGGTMKWQDFRREFFKLNK